jgi:hypothetical protein
MGKNGHFPEDNRHGQEGIPRGGRAREGY